MIGVSLSNLISYPMTTLDRGCGMSCLAASMDTKQPHHAAHAAHAVHEAHVRHVPHRAHEEFAGAGSSVLRGHSSTVTATTTTATWLLKGLPKVPRAHKTNLIFARFVFLLVSCIRVHYDFSATWSWIFSSFHPQKMISFVKWSVWERLLTGDNYDLVWIHIQNSILIFPHENCKHLSKFI